MNEEHKVAITLEEWTKRYKKRCYYANEIAELIFNLPPDQARKVKDLVEIFFSNVKSPEDLLAWLEEGEKIDSLARLRLLLEKHNQNLCCLPCAMAGLIGIMLKIKCYLEAPNSTLH